MSATEILKMYCYHPPCELSSHEQWVGNSNSIGAQDILDPNEAHRVSPPDLNRIYQWFFGSCNKQWYL